MSQLEIDIDALNHIPLRSVFGPEWRFRWGRIYQNTIHFNLKKSKLTKANRPSLFQLEKQAEVITFFVERDTWNILGFRVEPEQYIMHHRNVTHIITPFNTGSVVMHSFSTQIQGKTHETISQIAERIYENALKTKETYEVL